MALNPPISMSGIPLRLEGEYLMLERKHIESEFKIPVFGKKTGKGKLYITTARMVFVNADFAKSEFKSFDIPLLSLSNEKFEQPIFGSNYLSGTVKPIYGLLPGDTSFKLWFTSGGCQTFLNCFCRVVDQIRRGGQRGPDQRFLDQVRMGQFAGQKGFVDPNDPSVIYVSQPTETYNNVLSGNGQSQNYYGQSYQDPSFKGQGMVLGSNNPDIQVQMQQPPSYNQQPPSYNQQQPPSYNQQQQPPSYNQQQQQPPSYNQQQPPSYNQQPPSNNQQLPSYNQQPPAYNQAPPIYNQQQGNYNYGQPAQSYPPLNNQPPPQQYNQPPPQNQQFVPPQEFLSQEQNNNQEAPQNQNAAVQNANQQPQQPPQVNVAYYYGFPFGPQLKKNN